MNASTIAPSLTTPTHGGATTVRRHELDWLRTIAVFGLIPFHTAVIFTTGSYDYVKNAQTSAYMDILTSFISIWGIPLLFLVAGGASRFALATRSTGQYLNERVTRLLVPFIFGMLLIVPVQVYIGRLSAPTAPPSFPTFYLGFLQSLVGILQGHLLPGPEWIGHLWFIPPLMLFSALALPFAYLLRTRSGARSVNWLASALGGYAGLALLGAPLVVVQFYALEGIGVLNTIDTRFTSNAIGVMAFLLFFLYGYLLYLDDRFIASVRRGAWVSLALGAVAWLTLIYAAPGWQAAVGLTSSQEHVILALLRGYSSWWWVTGILGMAVRYLNFTTPAIAYLSRAAYPVYLIHMPILSLIAFWVVRLDANIALKFGLIVVASLIVSLAVYDALIRRIGVMRLLFGLSHEVRRDKPQRATAPRATAPRAPTGHSAPQRRPPSRANGAPARRVAQARLRSTRHPRLRGAGV